MAHMHVLIIDDHLLFAEAIGQALSDMGIGSVDVVTCGSEVWASISREHPDMVLIDIERSDCDGIELGRHILEALPATKVVALTSLEDPRAVHDAARAGFHGYLSKDSDPVSFRIALKRVAEDKRVFPQDMVMQAVPSPDPAPARRSTDDLLASQLTGRETQVLQLLTEGISSQEIAERLHLSHNTVRTYVQSILSKLQVHSRLEAAAFAVRNGLVTVPA
jgi:two-component system nitrate/nitrite response regulator NarL